MFEIQPNGQVNKSTPILSNVSALALYNHYAFDPVIIAETVKANFINKGAKIGILKIELPNGYVPTIGDYFTANEFAEALSWANKEVDRALTVQFQNAGAARFQMISSETVLIGVTAVVPVPSTLLLFGVGLAGLAGTGRRRQ